MQPRDLADSAYPFGLWKHGALVPSLPPTPYLQQGNNTKRELALLANSAGKVLRTMPGMWLVLHHRWLGWLSWLAKAMGVLVVKQCMMPALGSDCKGPWDTMLIVPNWCNKHLQHVLLSEKIGCRTACLWRAAIAAIHLDAGWLCRDHL